LPLQLGAQFFGFLFQCLRFGSPPIARPTQVSHLGAKRLDPFLQRLGFLESSREHPPRTAMPWSFLVASLGTFHRVRLHPKRKTPSYDRNSATDFSDSASPIPSGNRWFSTAHHRPVQRAFAKVGFEVRIIHPLTTKQHRQPANPGNKTDETDLAAMQLGAVNGFGLLEPPADPLSIRLPLLARHRRDLVEKSVALRSQIHEHLYAIMPGYSKCFEDIYDARIPLWIARQFGSATAILQAGLTGLIVQLRRAEIRVHLPTLEKILAWARTANAAEDDSHIHLTILTELDDYRLSKVRGVRAIEAELDVHFVI